MYRVVLFLIFLSPVWCFSQKTVVSEGEALIRVESSQSQDEVTLKSRQMACVNAIENAFGKVVMQGNSTFLQNSQSGDKSESTNVFSFMADSYVNGEWIETLKEKTEVIRQADGSVWIKAYVKGKVREIVTPISQVEVETLSCDSLLCKTTSFNSGQNLFVQLQTAKNGYVSIYLDDPEAKETFRIFPYQGVRPEKLTAYQLKADKPYILFSGRFDYFGEKQIIDELFLEIQSKLIQYKLFILFSPEPLDKPILSDKSVEFLTPAERASGVAVPKSIGSEKFQTWLQKIRSVNPHIELSTAYIQVKK